MPYRTERDVLGKVKIDSSAYYGSETKRAVDNFPVSGITVSPDFIHYYALIKKAAAKANLKSGKLSQERASAIIKAAEEVASGKFAGQFPVDVFQAGAGTSTNMNLNEVIANRAIELLGGRKGNYKKVHPNDHVNMSQSTNDTYHAAIRVAASAMMRKDLIPALNGLAATFQKKAAEFRNVVKIGRTHLQDAVPITLGDEMSGYYGAVEYAVEGLEQSLAPLSELPLGGTAVGTGINISKDYKANVIRELSSITKIKFKPARHMYATMQQEYAELAASNAIKTAAIMLGKIANDIRLLGSGPRAGLNELILPPVQPGSSIMPGKINPSMAEMLNMVCFQVYGNACTIEQACSAGQLELNVFMPVIAFDMLYSIKILSNAVNAFNLRCARGIKANIAAINANLERNLSLATALSPYIGYAKAAEIAAKAYREGKTVKEVCLAEGIMPRQELDRILNPKNLV